MEVMLRCAVPDRPGALAALAGAIGDAGGDIHAVEVVEADEDGLALDDLVVVISPGGLPSLLGSIAALDGVQVVHAGPSRGHPSDAVTRLALGLESLLNGAMDPEHGVKTLLGGLLRAATATVLPQDDVVDHTGDDHTLVLPCGEKVVVLRREYRFTDAERDRALAIVRVCREALLPRAAQREERTAETLVEP